MKTWPWRSIWAPQPARGAAKRPTARQARPDSVDRMIGLSLFTAKPPLDDPVPKVTRQMPPTHQTGRTPPASPSREPWRACTTAEVRRSALAFEPSQSPDAMALGDEQHRQTLWRDCGAGAAPDFLPESSAFRTRLQGRFALLSLHLFAVLHRLKARGRRGSCALARRLWTGSARTWRRCCGRSG